MIRVRSSEVLVRRLALSVLAALCVTFAEASTVRVAITGTTSAVYVEEGPIFGYSSYTHIRDGTPFVLTYTFDDSRGKEKILKAVSAEISESQIENATSVAPGTNATLQIGDATWEFGPSTTSLARLSASPDNRRYEFTFATPGRGNRVSIVIEPTKDGFWPTNADWRSSFIATSLMNNMGEFSADNGRVSATGKMIPHTITVSGVDLSGQWLSYTTTAGSPTSTRWERQWHLARPSPKGGYVIQEVTRTRTGAPTTGSGIASTVVKYWEAWKIPAHATYATEAADRLEGARLLTGDTIDAVSTTARFYEDLSLPGEFASGKSPYAGSQLSSISDPHLETKHATLPVTTEATLHY